MCGEGALTVDWIYQKWIAKFRAGDFSLDDAPQSSRPVEVDSNKIKTLIKNGQCSPRQEIADILQISKSIKLLVKMKNMSYILQKKVNGLFGQPNSSQSHQNVRKVGYSNSPSPLLQPHYHPVGLNSVSLLGLWSRGTHLETMFPCCFLCLFCSPLLIKHLVSTTLEETWTPSSIFMPQSPRARYLTQITMTGP